MISRIRQGARLRKTPRRRLGSGAETSIANGEQPGPARVTSVAGPLLRSPLVSAATAEAALVGGGRSASAARPPVLGSLTGTLLKPPATQGVASWARRAMTRGRPLPDFPKQRGMIRERPQEVNAIRTCELLPSFHVDS